MASILEAMSAAGCGDRTLAEELAAAVRHFLEARHCDPLDLDVIQDMVEKVLMETGHRTIARSYVLLRERRARIREQLEVRKRDSDSSPVVEGRHSRLSQPWERGRIARVLMEEADLGAEEAEEIARAVEERVFRSELRSISTALIRELVDNELFERGLTQRLKRQSSVSIPKYDLEQILFRGGDPPRGLFPGDSAQVAALAGDQLVRQYVVEEVYSQEVLDAHHNGAIYLHDLDSSLQLLRIAFQAENLIPARVGIREEGIFWRELFQRLRPLQSVVAEEIEVVRLGEGLLGERQFNALDPARAGRHLLTALAEFKRHCVGLVRKAPTLTLRVPFLPRMAFIAASGDLLEGGRNESEETSLFLVQSLYQMLLLLDEQSVDVADLLGGIHFRFEIGATTFDDRRFLNALWGVLEAFPREASLSFDIPAALGIAPPESVEGVLAGKVTINLPRIARATVNAGVSDPRAAVDRVTALVGRALAERAGFLKRLAVHPEGPLRRLAENVAFLSGPMRFAVGVLGLDDAVRIVTGKSLHQDPSADAVGVEWIDCIRAALARAETAGAPPLELEESASSGSLRQFFHLDANTDHETAAGAGSNGRSCTPGVRLSRNAPIDPVASWHRLGAYRHRMRLEPRLDDCAQLRADGAEVLLSCLQEIIRRDAGGIRHLRRQYTPPPGGAHRTTAAALERDL